MKRPRTLLVCLLLSAAASRASSSPVPSPAPAAPAATAPVAAQRPAAPPPSPATQEAAALAQRGNVNGAITRLERDRAQLDARGVSLLGALYLQAQRPAEALSVLRPLADAKDAAAAVLYNAGRAALLAGDTEHAQVYLARSVGADPTSPAVRDLGLLLSRQGQVVEAYALLRPWTLHHADDGDARLVAATLAITLERPQEAEQLLTGLVESPAVQLLHVRARVQLGDAAGAMRALQPVLAQQHPAAMDLEVRRAAAEAYLLAGQASKAVEQLAGKAG
ncbi:MAG TPA: hypothetical protein VGV61_16735, partial [Thermoanaerobaculia bacterium]|nr:hypothetical protein [Thermoanaerobaculia bacterium]